MKYIDMHCDTLVECYCNDEGLRKNSFHIDFERLNKNNSMAQFFAIFIPREETTDKGISPYDFFLNVYDFYKKELIKNKDIIRPAHSYNELKKNTEDSIPSSILTIEDADFLKKKIERVEDVYKKGVRLITLTWNNENCVGFPNSDKSEVNQKGLKEFGFEVVEEMNRLGMIIDVSHLSEGGFYDVLRHSRRPVVASHSCARSLCNHPRNLDDMQLKAIAEKDGLVGVNFNSEFLKENSKTSTVCDIAEHVKYMVSVMGIDHVGLGSDFDGIDCMLEIKDYSYYNLLVAELEKVFSQDEIEKICYKNLLRILKECL